MSLSRSTIIEIKNKSVGNKPTRFSDGSVKDLHQKLEPLRGQPGPLNLVTINNKLKYETLGGTVGFERRGGTVSTSVVKGGMIQSTNYGVFNPMIIGGKKIDGNNGKYLEY